MVAVIGESCLGLTGHIRETLIIHTDTPLFGVDVKGQDEADNLLLRDRRFEVMMVSDWSREGGFFEATCVRLGQ